MTLRFLSFLACAGLAFFTVFILFRATAPRIKRESAVVSSELASAQKRLAIEAVPSRKKSSLLTTEFRSTSIPSVDSPEKRAELYSRFGPILTELGLSHAQIDRVVQLRVRILDAYSDLRSATENADVEANTSDIESMRDNLTKPIWEEIRRLMGDDKFVAFRDHELMTSFRLMVSAKFTTAGVSVSGDQIERISRIALGQSLTGLDYPTSIYSWLQVRWPVVIRDSEKFLSSAQLEVLYDEAEYRAWRNAEKLKGPTRR